MPGFTTARLLAKLKNQAQAMVTRLRQDVYTDLVAVAITTAPPMPSVPNTGLPLVHSKQSRQNAAGQNGARARHHAGHAQLRRGSEPGVDAR